MIASNGHTFFFTILCIDFGTMDRPLVSLEPSTLQVCYMWESYIKGKKKLSNITVAGRDTKHIKNHHIKISIWFGTKLKMSHVNPLKSTS